MPKEGKKSGRPSSKVLTSANVDVENSQIQIPIVRTKSDDLVSMFSDGLLVQNREDMFTLSYLQTQFPLISNLDEAEQVTSVEQKCLFQIVCTPQQMARNIKAMSDNFKRYILQLPPEVQELLNVMAGFTDEKGGNTNGDNNPAISK